MITIVLYSVFYSGKHQRWRYSFENWISSSREFNNYFYIESYLRDLGIKRESKVITMYDKSFNITLYFMNVKGWRIYDKREDLKVIEYAAAGAEYLVVNDISVLNNEKLKPFFNNKIGEFRNILIYKIKE